MFQGHQWDDAIERLYIVICTLHLSSRLKLSLSGKALQAIHASLACLNSYMPITNVSLVLSVCTLLMTLSSRLFRMPFCN